MTDKEKIEKLENVLGVVGGGIRTLLGKPGMTTFGHVIVHALQIEGFSEPLDYLRELCERTAGEDALQYRAAVMTRTCQDGGNVVCPFDAKARRGPLRR